MFYDFHIVLIILLQLYVFTRLFTSFLDPILSPRQMRLHYEIVVLLLLIHCLFLTSLERYGLYDFFSSIITVHSIAKVS